MIIDTIGHMLLYAVNYIIFHVFSFSINPLYRCVLQLLVVFIKAYYFMQKSIPGNQEMQMFLFNTVISILVKTVTVHYLIYVDAQKQHLLFGGISTIIVAFYSFIIYTFRHFKLFNFCLTILLFLVVLIISPMERHFLNDNTKHSQFMLNVNYHSICNAYFSLFYSGKEINPSYATAISEYCTFDKFDSFDNECMYRGNFLGTGELNETIFQTDSFNAISLSNSYNNETWSFLNNLTNINTNTDLMNTMTTRISTYKNYSSKELGFLILNDLYGITMTYDELKSFTSFQYQHLILSHIFFDYFPYNILFKYSNVIEKKKKYLEWFKNKLFTESKIKQEYTNIINSSTNNHTKEYFSKFIFETFLFAGGQGLSTLINLVKQKKIENPAMDNDSIITSVLNVKQAPVGAMIFFQRNKNKLHMLNIIKLSQYHTEDKDIKDHCPYFFGRIPEKDNIGCPASDFCIQIVQMLLSEMDKSE